MVDKIRLALGTWINHSWGDALYVTTRGLTTSPIPCQGAKHRDRRCFRDALLVFLPSTYDVAAETGDWDRAVLEHAGDGTTKPRVF